jgi:hypothetical protein
MRTALLLALVAASFVTATAAEARRRPNYNNDYWEDRWENRRDARRAGIVAGAVAGSIARSAANERAENRYEQCVIYSGYDYECERRLYDDEMRARRAGRRTAYAVGIATREIVRD